MAQGERELQQFIRTAEPATEAELLRFVAEAMELLVGRRPEPGEWKAADGATPGDDPLDLPVARNEPGEPRCCAFGEQTLWALSPDGTLELVVEGLTAPMRLRLLRDEDTLLLSAVAEEARVKTLVDAFKARFKRELPAPDFG